MLLKVLLECESPSIDFTQFLCQTDSVIKNMRCVHFQALCNNQLPQAESLLQSVLYTLSAKVKYFTFITLPSSGSESRILGVRVINHRARHVELSSSAYIKLQSYKTRTTGEDAAAPKLLTRMCDVLPYGLVKKMVATQLSSEVTHTPLYAAELLNFYLKSLRTSNVQSILSHGKRQ